MVAGFELVADFQPTGDQPEAIAALVAGFREGAHYRTLEGVTGSGKTFTMANVIAQLNRPTLVISHNKTLAAQLYAELKEFFPRNAVEYFVSYYDYYQPEAYIPQTDTYIEKDASINEEIERLRLAATDALINREDVVIVASVSCIYGLGSPEDYRGMLVTLRTGEEFAREDIMRKLVDVQYTRNDISTLPGTFRARGDTLDIFPGYSQDGVRVEFFGDRIESLRRIDPLTGKTLQHFEYTTISPAKHFVMPAEKIAPAVTRVLAEMEARVAELEAQNKLLEAQRLRMRTTFDMEMLREVGYCSGIENYSGPLSGRPRGSRPYTLMDFFPRDFLTVIDESHVTLPQIRGMFNGDQARKRTLVEHGFRLPSALDNRPMSYDEFMGLTNQVLFTSATPGPTEFQLAGTPVPQIIRPTGILDPLVEVRPLRNQVDDLIEEVRQCAERKDRVLVTTLTKKTAEDLSVYLQNIGIRCKYLHSDITALDRVDILRGLRKADFDCLIGINLLREGLDLPEVALVAVLDADKEGFLRSETSLIQTAGRAARHLQGRVILYADQVTDSMQRMIDLTRERRRQQEEYNRAHGITPRKIEKAISESLMQAEKAREAEEFAVHEAGADYDVVRAIAEMEREMFEAAEAMEFERAALLRDQIYELKKTDNPFKGTVQIGKRKAIVYHPGKRLPGKRPSGTRRRKS
ncbi:MAG: excinuclease ABC subunit UvrB [Kiritimatiellia bacterium]|nr:excinuclease ABC subunit UvrB [Kiritimatiellia bacterium]